MTPVRRRLANVLGRAETVLVDFDGPVAEFGPALDVEAFRRRAFEHLTPSIVMAAESRPLRILDYAYERGAQQGEAVEGVLREAEVAAAVRARLVPGAADVLAACRDTGREVGIVGSVVAEAIMCFSAPARFGRGRGGGARPR